MKYLFWITLILLVIFRYFSTLPKYVDGERLRISTTLSTEPTITFGKQRFNLVNLKIALPNYPEIHYGDYVVIEGLVNNGELTDAVLKENKLTQNLFIKFRHKLVDFYNHALPSPHGSLLAGITIGAKSDLPKEFADKLKNTGTTHVVVASGMNLTMVAGFASAIFLKVMSRRKMIILLLFVVLIYCFISGFQPPIVRAAFMIVIAYTSQLTGRVYYAFRSLLLSGLIMLIIVPSWATDVGFLLSFATTASLILFANEISSKLAFVLGIFRESLATSFAAQIGSSPIIYFFFGRFNLLSPLINAIVLWVVSPVMIIGIVGGVIGILIPEVGKIILLLSYPLTSWFIFVVNLLG